MRSHILFCFVVLWPLFLTVHGWENVRLSRCLHNLTVNLYAMSFDNCLRYDNYDVEAGKYPGVDFPISVEVLECLYGHDAFRSCTSCYLCHHYLHHNQDISAYKSVVRSLGVSPRSAPALSCLAALYLKQGSHVRASFYSSLAVHYNHSLHIHYNFLESESVYDHMNQNFRAILFPDYSDLIAFLYYVEGKDARILQHHDIFSELLSALDGTKTLVRVYSDHLHLLPRRMVGPSVLAYEEFLSHIEDLLLWYADIFLRFTGEPLPGGTGVTEGLGALSELDKVPDVVPVVQWPHDKTVVILVQPKFGGHTMTFDENVHGMCDALAKLGVPFRTVTRLMPDNDFVSLQNYGVEMNEVMDKNYILWNFEKNPRMAKELETPGMRFDECGNDHAVVDVEYVRASVMVWETVPFNLFLWEDSVASKMQLVTSPLPDEMHLRTRAEQLFMDKIGAKMSTDDFYSQMDASRPIDILFYGNSNEHREALFTEFTSMAKSNNLRIEFKMSYNLFGSHKESLIDQAKVVLNLANRAWPRNLSHPGGADSSRDTSSPAPCAAAINLHRIRSLLARGKVVLSESTGSDLEEDMHEGLLAFAPTSQLTAVALELLRDPEARWRLERYARRFMTADHFSTTVPAFSASGDLLSSQPSARERSASRRSSLALVAQALQTTAGKLWPDRAQGRSSSPSEGGELGTGDILKQRKENVERRYQRSLDELSFLSRQKTDEAVMGTAHAAYAFSWAEMRCQGSRNELNDLHYHNPISTIMYGSIGGRNSSNICDQRVDLEVWTGYLARRFQYKGNKVLLVGCDDTLATKIRKAFDVQFREKEEHINFDISCMSPEQFQATTSPPSSLDLIVINQAMLTASFITLKPLFTQAVAWLNTKYGSVLINGMLPAFKNYRKDEDWLNSDAYQLLIHMRSLRSFDAALGNFEGGLLVVHPRRNPYRVTQEDLDGLKFSYTDFRKHIDKVIPVLNFAELHDWFSNAMYTTRFVRSLRA